MTVVLAVKVDNKTVLAADTCITVNERRLTNIINGSKLVPFDHFVVGLAGNGPLTEILDRLMNSEEDDWRGHRIETRMDVGVILDKFMEYFEEMGEPDEKQNVELLWVTPDHIFCSVGESIVFEVSKFWAIGSGSDGALIGMDLAYDQTTVETLPATAKRVLESVCKFNPSCGLPLDCLELIDQQNS